MIYRPTEERSRNRKTKTSFAELFGAPAWGPAGAPRWPRRGRRARTRLPPQKKSTDSPQKDSTDSPRKRFHQLSPHSYTH